MKCEKEKVKERHGETSIQVTPACGVKPSISDTSLRLSIHARTCFSINTHLISTCVPRGRLSLYYSCSLMHVQRVHTLQCWKFVLKSTRISGHISKNQLMRLSHSAFGVDSEKAKNVHACAPSRANMHTKSTTSHSSTNTHTRKFMLPMRQMRSERSHIKQANLSCFAFIA